MKWLLQSEWRETFIPSLGTDPWITVYFDKVTEDENLGIFSAIIPNAYVETSLNQISWDFHLEHGHPCFNQSNKNPTYLRFGNLDDVEPFIIHRDFHGIRDSYNEIIERILMQNSHYVSLQRSGKNQVITIPHEFALPGTEVLLRKEGDRLIIA